VDQGYVSPTAGHYVRLALIFFCSVIGLLLLGFAFGSSSASADDGGPDGDGLVPAVADAVGGVAEHIAPVVSSTAAVPLADVPLPEPVVTLVSNAPAAGTVAIVSESAPLAGKILASSPVSPVVTTLVKAIDTTAAALVAPLLHATTALLPVTTLAAGLSTSAADVPAGWVSSGSAAGTLGVLLPTSPVGSTTGVSGMSLAGSWLPAVALGAGFLVLLRSRRLGLVNSAVPVSPVYETDTSPD